MQRQYMNVSYAGKIFRVAPFILKRGKTLHSSVPEKTCGASNKLLFSTRARKLRTSLSHESHEGADVIKTPKKTEESSLKTTLTSWALQYNISTHALTQLFKVLANSGVEDLPKSSRSILKKREEGLIVCSIPPGRYVHLGLENNLRKIISVLIEKQMWKERNIEVSVFIDNLILSKATQKGLWAILGSVIGFDKFIFIIGAYFGSSKPKNSNLFLNMFVNEVKSLHMNGLKVNQNEYSVSIKRIICDAPAKAYILNVKHSSGYSSCTKCDATGVYGGNKVYFPEKSKPWTDKHFESKKYCDRDKTNLLDLPNFGLVSNVPIDYMHLVCLGVVKKLLSIWLSKKSYWLSKCGLSKKIKDSCKFKPAEFQTQLKPFTLYTSWRSTNFRQFLLYSGPVLLKNSLLAPYYDHFLYLHVACRLFCFEHSEKNAEKGRKLLDNFIKTFKVLYGENEITHSVHGLYHLADDYKLHGTLDNFSAFPYELYLLKLRHIMRMSRRRSMPLSVLSESHDKILYKSLERFTKGSVNVSKVVKTSGDSDLKFFQDYKQYQRLVTDQFLICSQKPGEKYLLLKNGKIIEVKHILRAKKTTSGNGFYVAGNEFLSARDFYRKPMKSSLLDVFEVENVSSEVGIWPLDAIKAKCMMIPLEKDKHVMAGLLNYDF